MLIKTIPEFLIFWLNIPDVKHFNHSAKFKIYLPDRIIDLKSCKYKDRSFRYLSYQNDRSYLKYVDNNDTVSYGCIGAATLGEKNATLVKGVRQIGI